MCHPEFIASGVLGCLSENLPFDLVGSTSSSQCINGQAGEPILTIFVMTADDVQFIAGVTSPVNDGIEGPLQSSINKISPDQPGSPSLILAFTPLLLPHSGEAYIRAWEQAIPNVPIFGPVTVDDSADSYEDSQTLFRGGSYIDAVSFVLCYGNVNPRFIIGTLPVDKALPFIGTATKSSGTSVHEINDMNARRYFDGIGTIEKFLLVPFAIHQKKRQDYDGIPVIRSMATFAEDGTAIFRGEVDQGSSFTMLACNDNDVLETSRQKAEQIDEMENVAGALLFSCIGRRMATITPNPLAELQLVKDAISPDVPFMMGYAGGEMCPTSMTNGIPVNRFHNHSIIILVV
jgi:hypothetical protein